MDNTSAPYGQPVLDTRKSPPGRRTGGPSPRAPSPPKRGARPDLGLNPAAGVVCSFASGRSGNARPEETAVLESANGARSGIMRDRWEPRKAGPALRVAAALLAVFHLAALACLAPHHHANPHDNAPCLVCAGTAAPAAQIEHAPAPAPPAAPAGPAICSDESPDTYLLPYSFGIRAPPAS
jgi:hypothetical protein